MMQVDYLEELKRRSRPADVSDEVIAKLPNKLAAIRLCIQVSGLEPKQICAAIGNGKPMDPGQYTRILNGEANFPTNAENALMDVCGNEIPLRWMALARGYELKRRLSAVEEENARLRAEIAERDARIEIITEFARKTGRG